jgi:hypothetical protein
MDLNRDELIQVDLRANYSELKRLWLPKTAVEADFLVSMAQGENPSLVWRHSQHEEHVWHRPGEQIWMAENILHWNGIQQSILDVCATSRNVPSDMVPVPQLAQVCRFQRQAASYRGKFVSSPNSLLSKSRFEDSPYRWYK